jgi:hypothetical protein
MKGKMRLCDRGQYNSLWAAANKMEKTPFRYRGMLVFKEEKS